MIKTLRIASGSNTFQPKLINWSYLNLGKVALSQMKNRRNMSIYMRNHTTGARNGPCHPPKNSVVARAETLIILPYSPRKNMANFMDEYSV